MQDESGRAAWIITLYLARELFSISVLPLGNTNKTAACVVLVLGNAFVLKRSGVIYGRRRMLLLGNSSVKVSNRAPRRGFLKFSNTRNAIYGDSELA